MKYEEFRNYLTVNKIHFQEDEEKLGVAYHVEISKTQEHRIVISITLVNFPNEFELIRKALELAETPLDEREEEKKYYLKHKFINNYSTKNYINVAATENVILSGRLCEDQVFRTKFTKAEIEEFKEKFDTDLRDFEIIEVKEA